MRDQRAYSPAPLPADVAEAVRDLLRSEHARDPFLPTDPRGAAHRVAGVVSSTGVEARVLRGTLDLGLAELDHLFVVVGDSVVDAALPVNDRGFLTIVRAWIAGDADRGELVEAAAGLEIGARVVGLFPAGLRYRGAPLWGSAA